MTGSSFFSSINKIQQSYSLKASLLQSYYLIVPNICSYKINIILFLFFNKIKKNKNYINSKNIFFSQ